MFDVVLTLLLFLAGLGTGFGQSTLQFATNSSTVPDWASLVLLAVQRTNDINTAVSVDYATADGTATNGLKYAATDGTLVFDAGETNQTIVVQLLDFNEGLVEGTKTFRVILSNPTNAVLGACATNTVSIFNVDVGVQFQFASYNTANGWAWAEDAGAILIGVVRGDDANIPVTVDCFTTDITAINGLDYTGLTNTLAFAPQERLKFVSIPILNDSVKEANKTNVWENVGDFMVTVLRGNDGDLGPITVDYSTSNLTAIAGQDYQAVSGTLEFQANETVKTLHISILPDGAVETNESFRVMLNNPTGGATLGTASTTVEILDGTGQGKYVTVAPPFDTALTIRREWVVNHLTWAGGGQLQRADRPTGPWQTLLAATNPVTVQSPVPTTYYRVTRPRPVKLYVPSSYDGQTNMPLVILLHGYGAGASGVENYMQLQPLAEARGFLYCAPDGLYDRLARGFWNAADSCCDFWSTGVDDAGYLRGLIEGIGRQFAVDPKRIHLIGHSNGGWLAYRMACESADLIAGIASLAGMTFLDTSRCIPSQPVNVLHIHGNSDTGVPYAGGALGIQGGPFSFPANLPAFPGALQVVQTWAANNGARDPVTDPNLSLDLDLALAGLDTVITRYTNSPPGGAVELWTMNGGSHVPTFHSSSAASEFAPRVIDWLLAHPKP